MAVNSHPVARVAVSRPRLPVWRWVAVTLACILSTAAGAGLTYVVMKIRRTADMRRAYAFELKVGEQTYLVTEDKPFRIKGSGGETIDAYLRRKNQLKFERDGVSFAYPSTMRVRASTDGGHTNFAIDCMDSPEVIINAFEKPAVLSVAKETFEQKMAEGMKSAGAEIIDGSEKPVQRLIGGVEQTGKSARYELHDLTVHQETFAFENEKKVFTVVVQYHASDAKLAKRYFEVILPSLQ